MTTIDEAKKRLEQYMLKTEKVERRGEWVPFAGGVMADFVDPMGMGLWVVRIRLIDLSYDVTKRHLSGTAE